MRSNLRMNLTHVYVEHKTITNVSKDALKWLTHWEMQMIAWIWGEKED